MKLYAGKDDMQGMKVRAVAAFADVKLGLPPFTAGKDDKKADFLQKSPFGTSPVLETCQGSIFDCNAIIRHIARSRPASGLYGDTLLQAAQVDAWVNVCSSELQMMLCCKNAGHNEEFEKFLTKINEHLVSRTYFVGERITLADIAFTFALSEALSKGMTKPDGKPNLKRWFMTMRNQSAIKQVLGEMKCCSGNACDAKPAEDDAPEESTKKATNPLELLTPSSLVLDDWKKKYSNTKDLYGEAMPWFWTNYDAAGWSVWYMKYEKLQDECTVPYVTSNQAGGFLQRTDPSFRKYSFGVINIVGEGKSYDIEGVWMVRGLELPQEMKDHPSFEYHTFRKLDLKNAADKKLLEDHWCSDDSVSNRKIVDSKVWK